MHTFLLTVLAVYLFVGSVQCRPLYSLALLSLGGLEQEPVLLPDFASSIFNANREKVLALEKSFTEPPSSADGTSLSITDVNDRSIESNPDLSTAASAASSPAAIDDEVYEDDEDDEVDMTRIIEEDFDVDINRFAQLLSVHLLFDHFENAVTNLSKKVSRRFQETIQFSILYGNGDSDIITEESIGSGNEMTFDIQVLKGQIRGAVGCKYKFLPVTNPPPFNLLIWLSAFIEDNLPNVWYQHATSLDKASLQQQIRQITMSLCGPYSNKEDTVLYSCIAEHSNQLQSQMDRFVGKNLDRTLAFVTKRELPRLFEATASEVHSVLLYFNRHVLLSSDKRLQIQLARQAEATEEEWIRKEVGDVFEAAAHWEHGSDEDQTVNSVAKFAQLAKA
ncbi:hypothetical protein K450DRAFT_225626 [Umbelopsis ramanniana AG]|uniref:Uncharacterized protein n=1 Tax=Umbelopsis ramanniana AG TaxID=1314678 RepID=A0AAD5EIJ4_UMBRA|nr:uncharacterized protein K450DRAFT_225626 [Umbelopsis ramanniana AG]KAI8582955.1 hypothetical protein K450DRAFT_225626 [Umbelopsis ramanniana AG]